MLALDFWVRGKGKRRERQGGLRVLGGWVRLSWWMTVVGFVTAEDRWMRLDGWMTADRGWLVLCWVLNLF